MKQISVTHLITTIEIGGAENQLLILIKQQIQMGYEVRVVPLKGKLEPHVHYRVCGEAGWLGRINTIMLHPIELEGFYPYRVTDLADTAASIF